MKDTVEMPAAGVYLLEKFFSRSERAELFRSWYVNSLPFPESSPIPLNRAGSSSMLLKGGADVWGDASGAPDVRTPTSSPAW